MFYPKWSILKFCGTPFRADQIFCATSRNLISYVAHFCIYSQFEPGWSKKYFHIFTHLLVLWLLRKSMPFAIVPLQTISEPLLKNAHKQYKKRSTMEFIHGILRNRKGVNLRDSDWAKSFNYIAELLFAIKIYHPLWCRSTPPRSDMRLCFRVFIVCIKWFGVTMLSDAGATIYWYNLLKKSIRIIVW